MMMMETTIEQALETFRKLLPLTNVYVDAEEMRYTFRTEGAARYFEGKADELIIKYCLPLESDVLLWRSGGVVFEAQLVVKFVPEMSMLNCY